MSEVRSLAERVLTGDRRALARAISEVENQTEQGRQALRALFPHGGRAQVIGVTGSAGSGKSTLCANLARAYRRLDKEVGIVAVDPSSPFTRGAILGDRIRMQELTADTGIFLRSVATRGSLGGLSATTVDVVSVLAASGREVILIETVGAGQDEVEVASIAQTTLVINTPGMGDDVQAIKAGILEVADVLAVNKADLPGADAVVAQLQALLSFAPPAAWQVPVVPISALKNEGIDRLLEAIDAHQNHLRTSTEGAQMRVDKARRAILTAVRAEVARRAAASDLAAELDTLAQSVAARALDPHAAAVQLAERLR